MSKRPCLNLVDLSPLVRIMYRPAIKMGAILDLPFLAYPARVSAIFTRSEYFHLIQGVVRWLWSCDYKSSDTYAALSKPVLFARVKQYLLWQVFAENILFGLHILIRVFKIYNNQFLCQGSVSVACSSTHMQNVHTCPPGTSYDKPTHCMQFITWKKVNK